MTEAAFRKLALALPGSEERQHMNHPDFRVEGKIFATMGYPRAGWAMIKLTPADQLAFTSMDPEAFVPVKGAWGARGCTNVLLKSADAGRVGAALGSAYDALAKRAAGNTPRRRARAAAHRGAKTKPAAAGELRWLLSGGDRRSIAESNRVRQMVEIEPSLVTQLAALTADEDELVAQRALDLMEKLAHDHMDWIAPHKKIFIGALAASDRWEVRLQIVRALPLFRWSGAQATRVEAILLENVMFPQLFVRAWALDGLATLAERKGTLMPVVLRHLREFERSASKALQARARQIRARLEGDR